MVTSRDWGIGRVFSANFAPDGEVGFRLAAAGSKGALRVWDTSTNPAVRRAFAHRLGGVDPMLVEEEGKESGSGRVRVKERLVGLQDGKGSEDEDDDDDDEDGGGGVGLDGRKGGEEDGWESMEE